MESTPTTQANGVRVRVDADQRTPLRRIWRYVGYDEPNYTYTPNGRELLVKLGGMADGALLRPRALPALLRRRRPAGPSGARRTSTPRTPTATRSTPGTILDRIFDTWLEAGCVPFVELGFMPEALTTAPAGTPYDDVRAGRLALPAAGLRPLAGPDRRRSPQHCLRALRPARGRAAGTGSSGTSRTSSTGPGRVEEYCRLYDHTVAGPARASCRRLGSAARRRRNPTRPEAGAFLRAFLEHCVRGTQRRDRRGTGPGSTS